MVSPFTAILLLAKYHFDDEIKLSSSGLAGLYFNEKTLEAGGYWEKAIKILKDKFGYEFESKILVIEFEIETLLFKPKRNNAIKLENNPTAKYKLRQSCVP